MFFQCVAWISTSSSLVWIFKKNKTPWGGKTNKSVQKKKESSQASPGAKKKIVRWAAVVLVSSMSRPQLGQFTPAWTRDEFVELLAVHSHLISPRALHRLPTAPRAHLKPCPVRFTQVDTESKSKTKVVVGPSCSKFSALWSKHVYALFCCQLCRRRIFFLECCSSKNFIQKTPRVVSLKVATFILASCLKQSDLDAFVLFRMRIIQPTSDLTKAFYVHYYMTMA